MAAEVTHPAVSAPAWLDRQAYPFTSRWIELPDGRMHYVDEGTGEVLVFVHGNPSWSFEFRRLIASLSASYRCIAPDHLGFGLSDKPPHVSYLPQFHAANLARFIETLGLRQVTLVVHDWGGPIALDWAVAHPTRVHRLVAFNSWFFDVRNHTVLRNFSAIIGSAPGRWLCRWFNFFPRVLLKASFGDPSRLPRSLHAHYLKPFPEPDSRKGTWVFPRAIVGESGWLSRIWARRDAIAQIPTLLIWGMKDRAFGPLLPQWREAFLNHHCITLEDVSHNVAEEAGERLIAPIANFLREAHA